MERKDWGPMNYNLMEPCELVLGFYFYACPKIGREGIKIAFLSSSVFSYLAEDEQRT